jgi:hypothetical protein
LIRIKAEMLQQQCCDAPYEDGAVSILDQAIQHQKCTILAMQMSHDYYAMRACFAVRC